MKDYFISFDFWQHQGAQNKFVCVTIKADLSKESIDEIAKALINKNFQDIDTTTVVYKVNAFNLI
jgi:hypothetical protein